MPSIELAEITTPYEFEDRAFLFIEAVTNMVRRKRSVHVEIENKTLEKIRECSQMINKINAKGDSGKAKKLYILEHDLQVESADKNGVIVFIYSHYENPILKFSPKLDAMAKAFRGVRNEDDDEVMDFGDDESMETYRFLKICVYDFKNDFRKLPGQKPKG